MPKNVWETWQILPLTKLACIPSRTSTNSRHFRPRLTNFDIIGPFWQTNFSIILGPIRLILRPFARALTTSTDKSTTWICCASSAPPSPSSSSLSSRATSRPAAADSTFRIELSLSFPNKYREGFYSQALPKMSNLHKNTAVSSRNYNNG